MKYFLYIILSISIYSSHSSEIKLKTNINSSEFQKYTPEQDSIMDFTFEKIRTEEATLYSPLRQSILDEGLIADSTISNLWQQKAMHLYKQGKYELGLAFLDKAVKYNRREYLPYRAFMKWITPIISILLSPIYN